MSHRAQVVIVGHVDHGKSTVVGRLLADTGSLPDGKLEQVRALCERTSRPFEYAFLLDALKDERAQGITIDAARVFFHSARRHYIIIDAPGHIEFLKNMITGASRADAALLVIDAQDGVRENSRRHATMLSMLGIGQVAVLVNKMDLVGWRQEAFDAVVAEMQAFLTQLGVRPAAFIPVSGREGAMLVRRAPELPWYAGPTVLEALDAFELEPAAPDAPFRLPVQDVYKFTRHGDDRRIVAGTVASGRLRVGDEITFYPSGKRSRVRSLEAFNRAAPAMVEAGEAAGLTLEEQVYAARGELATRAGEPPPLVTSRLRVTLFWLGRAPLTERKDYLLRLGTARVSMRVEAVERVMDASSLSSAVRAHVERHEVADCVLQLQRAVAFDRHADLAQTGRFVVVDDYEIRGGGIVREALSDDEEWVRRKVLLRNSKWESSRVSPDQRAERYNQRATLLLVTGERASDRKGFAKEIEAGLFAMGRVVYYLGMGNVLYGVDADIARNASTRQEHFRRLGEVANILLDAGLILVVSAAELTAEDLRIIRVSVPADRITTVWVGGEPVTDVACDLVVADPEHDGGLDRLKALLQDQGVIYRPW